MIIHFAKTFHIKQNAMNSVQSFIHQFKDVLTYDKESDMIVNLLNESHHHEMNVKLLNVSHFEFTCISSDEDDCICSSEVEPHFNGYTFDGGSDEIESHFSFNISKLNNPTLKKSPIVNPFNWFSKA